MPRTDAKKTYRIMDIWQAYVYRLLQENKDCWSRYENYTSNYAIYRKVGNKVEEVMNYKRFTGIVRTYFRRAKKAIINGEALNMTACVGKICARRVERDFRKNKQRKIDWGKTRQQPKVWNEARGKMEYAKKIYYTTDDWCRIGWHKTGSITNELSYEFKPSAPSSTKKTGFELEFSQALIADPLLKYQYLFYPVKNFTPKKNKHDIQVHVDKGSDRPGDTQYPDPGLLIHQ